ncbi:TRAP transporter substrate-binding protein DctP [Sporosarcina sp. P33]|uniref:TRAP transporter substrate-binding protein DctP n=1 Tax=Sporosarcina sp. P33 TaxID=1930764 RepID=UPI0009BD0D9D|nr:TRAP transporter substrate-binding protein DctP [Sporosarcina sp. P33]ARD47952.1 hypothetical protein SporoP33_06735 [Sporosarcina sp. P33]
MKKKFSMIPLLLIAIMVLSACGASNGATKVNGATKEGDASKTIKLKFAVSQPETHSLFEWAYTPFMERVTELTDGQVEFEFYPSEQMGKSADLYDLTSSGVTDISFIVSTYTPSMMPITSGLLGMPGLYSNAYEGSMALHALNKKSPVLEADFLNNGVRPIMSHALPPNEFWTKGKKIAVPADVKGMKVRSNGEIINQAVLALNASPINLTAAEMYEGFDRGVFDGLLLNALSMNDYGFSELVQYGTVGVDFGGLAAGLIINENAYQKLPENIQKVLEQVGDEVSESYAKKFDEINDSVIKDLRGKGITLYELTEDEQSKWHDYYDEVERNWLSGKSGYDFEAILAEFKEEVENVRDQQ